MTSNHPTFNNTISEESAERIIEGAQRSAWEVLLAQANIPPLSTAVRSASKRAKDVEESSLDISMRRNGREVFDVDVLKHESHGAILDTLTSPRHRRTQGEPLAEKAALFNNGYCSSLSQPNSPYRSSSLAQDAKRSFSGPSQTSPVNKDVWVGGFVDNSDISHPSSFATSVSFSELEYDSNQSFPDPNQVCDPGPFETFDHWLTTGQQAASTGTEPSHI